MSHDLTEFVVAISSLSERMAVTLLHFLWQGAIAGLLVLVTERYFRGSRAGFRYRAYSALMFSLPVVVLVTCLCAGPETDGRSSEFASSGWTDSAQSINAPKEPAAGSDVLSAIITIGVTEQVDLPSSSLPEQMIGDAATESSDAARFSELRNWAPIVVIGWLSGVFCFLGRLAHAAHGTSHLKATSQPVEDELLLANLKEQVTRLQLK